MRIQKIRFKNLNSLAGEWEVDFTADAYRTSGLFAITGPTGAGKSTLLDALCLALYGRTPRLERVNKSGNEIMSRRTGECHAEVTFETQAGLFRCTWSQNRARKKPDGELQMHRHEIVDARTGTVLETKIKDVAAKVEEVTGMDFKRFTRSMLLAQGGFSAFLQAEAEERASILEQITGTDIYSEISMQVHKRHAAERNRLDVLDAELGGIRVLSAEQVQALEQDLAARNGQEAERTAQLQTVARQMAWLEGLEKLGSELDQLKERQLALEERRNAFEPDRLRAEKASRALEAAAEAARLALLRQEQASDTLQCEAAQRAVEVCAASVMETEARWREKEAVREAGTAQVQALQPMLREARRLDVEIRERLGPLQDQERSCNALQAERGQLAREQAQARERHAQVSGQMAALQDALRATAADETLVMRLAGFEAHLDQARVRMRQWREGLTQRAEAAAARVACEADHAARVVRHGTIRNQVDATLVQLEQARESARKAFDGHPAAQWHAMRGRLDAHRVRAEKLAELAERNMEEARRLADHQTAIETGGREQVVVRAELAAAETVRTAQLQDVAGLEDKRELLRRIADLTEERNRLLEGVPCPLCGSIEHPYASGHMPAADPVESELAEVRKRLVETAETVERLRVRDGMLSGDLKRSEEAVTACRDALASLEERIAAERGLLAAEWTDIATTSSGMLETVAGWTDIATTSACMLETVAGWRPSGMQKAVTGLVPVDHEVRVAAFRSFAAACAACLDGVDVRVRLGDGHEKTVLALRDDMDRMREALAASGNDVQATARKADAARLSLEQRQRDVKGIGAATREAVALLCAEVAAYGEAPATAANETSTFPEEALPADAAEDAAEAVPAADAAEERLVWLETVLATLDGRRLTWQHRRTEHQALVQELALLSQQLELQALRLSQVEEVYQRTLQTCEDIRLQMRTAEQDRSGLLEGLSADEAERAANHRLEQAQAAAAEAQSALKSLQEELATRSAQAADRERAMAERAIRITAAVDAFTDRLASLGFPDETAWHDAMLPEADRKALATSLQAFGQEAHALQDRLNTVLALRQSEQARALTEESLDGLSERHAEATQARDTLQRAMGAIRQQMEENEALRALAADRLAAKAAQQAVCARWARLHELIGSSDGKKYRNFAQGLTFEMMVRHANRQLVRLSDRYLLARDSSQPLELLVIDNYQAGEMRSTKNLSGGESFLVSLSLALGLSHMASRKVRVDSLFLDEGFGTLDEETLSTALDTLAGLERDGKLIGVISHVTALKERITTQIQVAPQANGRSVLSGNGVRRLA